MPIPSSETPEPSPAGGSEAAEPVAAVPADSPEPSPTTQTAPSAPGTSDYRARAHPDRLLSEAQHHDRQPARDRRRTHPDAPPARGSRPQLKAAAPMCA